MAREEVAARLGPGDAFPELELQTTDGTVALRDRWAKASLVIAFMRHFG